METLHFETVINASKEAVWDAMLGSETFREWTRAFDESSNYQGDWQEGSRMLFIGSDGNGMVSVIAENRPYEFISIKHIGILNRGVEDTDSPEAMKWAPAFENYTFTEEDSMTRVLVDVDVHEEYRKMMEDSWPKALASLKEICER